MNDTDTRGIAPHYETVMRPEVLKTLRKGFKQMNRGMVLLFRLGLGRLLNAWPSVGGRILVLNHVGRRSGRSYRTPVNYAESEHSLYCIAAFGNRTDWYRNALAEPALEVWLPDGRWRCQAEDASSDPRRLELVRAVLIASGFAAPLVGLRPRRMSDSELKAATETYRVLRLRRRDRLEGGAGDLAWVWPIGLGVLVNALAIQGWRRQQRFAERA
jgi:deazaflavin-dependent oxidoreductase (nitroreductase family)